MNPDPEDVQLTAYALGELPASEVAEVEARLATSAEARQEVDEIRQLAGTLTQAFAQEVSRSAPIDPIPGGEPPVRVAAESSVESEIPVMFAGEDNRVVAMPTAGVRWSRWGLLAAAAGLLFLAATWWLPTLNRPEEQKRLALQTVAESHPGDGDPSTLTPTRPPSGTTSPVDSVPPSIVFIPARPATGREVDGAAIGPVGSNPGSDARTSPAQPLSTAVTHVPSQTEMSPQLMNRYGLAPAPRPVEPNSSSQGGEKAPDGVLLTQSSSGNGGMSPALRARYGLGVGGNRGAAAPSASTLAPAVASGGDPYFRERPVPRPESMNDLSLIHESRRKLATLSDAPASVAEPGRNPGYVDAGENLFQSPLKEPLSTFGLDVDTGSYANVRRFLNAGMFPPRAAVRVEEMINYFPYNYPAPAGDDVFGVQAEVAPCPWEPRHRLVRIAIRAKGLSGERPPANLVFLVDVSGSMQPGDRLPLLKQGLRALVKRLSPADRVAIVTYASSAGVRLASTSAEEKDRILEAIDGLEAGGSTNGEGGIRQAYAVARSHLIPGGVNRVLLCTDGDFNVGISDQNELVALVEQEARSGVFLTALGVGTDNFKDALMRQVADRGNGSYHYLDSFEEAQRVLLEQRDATFVTVARDAKAQVEFNPGNVAAWRLVGYEKRLMANQDFNDDTKDAGEIGAGQSVTVLYEIVPAGERVPGNVDPLKYQPSVKEEKPARILARGEELLTVKLRYQRPQGSPSVLKEVALPDRERPLEGEFRFSAAVASFGMALRDPRWHQGRGFDLALELASRSLGEDPGGWRAEFLTLVRKARGMPRRAATGFEER